MNATLAVCALLWPFVLALLVGWWFDHHPDQADRWGERISPHRTVVDRAEREYHRRH